MKINPATKAAACKALGAFAERSVAMADAIAKVEDDPNAPTLLPEEMSLSVTTMGADFAKEMGALLPQAAAAGGGGAGGEREDEEDPELEMTAEMVTALESGVAKMNGVVDTIEKGLKSALTTKTIAKVAKGLEDVDSFRKALGELPVAKAGGAKKLTFQQYMKMQGSLMERFMTMVMEFLPMLIAADGSGLAADAEPASSPAGAGVSEPAVDMAKAVDMAVAKAMDALDARFASRLTSVNDQLTAISKSRDGSNAIRADGGPSLSKNGEDDDAPHIPFTSLNDQLRERGKLPKLTPQ